MSSNPAPAVMAPASSAGIVAAGVYVPQTVMTAADIARETGIPESVIRDKFGITQKVMPGPADHTNQMGIWAAQDCLSKAGIKPDETTWAEGIGQPRIA